MIAAKGSQLHRKAGNMFTISMLIMTGSAAIVSFFLRTDHVTGVVALVTAYLVGTSWLVVKRKVADSYRLLAGLAVVAAMVGRDVTLAAATQQTSAVAPAQAPAASTGTALVATYNAWRTAMIRSEDAVGVRPTPRHSEEASTRGRQAGTKPSFGRRGM